MEEPQATPKLLATKTAEAIQQYALKNYAAAADLYSRASVVQAELNGEMAPENAELLYAYGRCLYHVAIGKSDVLGEKVVGTGSGGDKPRGKKRKGAGGKAEFKSAEVVSQEHMDSTAGERSSDAKKSATTPYFQIEGDDVGWDSDESDGEDVDSEGEGPQGNDDAAEEEEVDDDFAIAYEILDTARILFLRRIEELSSSDLSNTSNRRSSTTPSKGKAKADDTHTTIEALNPAMRHFQELLADTYDLQSEISLENERFADATVDSKASLALKQQLYPTDSSMIAEAHFKVSLALEFGAKTTTEKIDELDGGGREEVEGVDEEMRKESARHMALAIESTKLRVEREQKEFEACNNKEDKEKRRKGIVDVKEMIADMEQRVCFSPFVCLAASASAMNETY